MNQSILVPSLRLVVLGISKIEGHLHEKREEQDLDDVAHPVQDHVGWTLPDRHHVFTPEKQSLPSEWQVLQV